jgi:hypothetical protein
MEPGDYDPRYEFAATIPAVPAPSLVRDTHGT